MTIDAETKAKVKKYGLASFIILAIAYFFVYFHRTTGGAISESLQDFFGVGPAAVALLASAYLYAYTLMQIPSGILTDRLGPRKAASAFIILLAFGSVLCAVSAMDGVKNFNLMVAGKFLIGIGAAVIYIPIMKILAVWFRKNEFATMSGILLLIGNVGGIAAAAPMVILMDSLGIAMTYVILAVITVAIGVLTYIVVRNHPHERGLPGVDEIVSEETGEPIRDSTSAKMGTKEALKMTFTGGRKFWPLAIWFFFLYGTMMLWQASQAGGYYNANGVSKESYSTILMMVGIGMVVGSPLAGKLSDKILKSRKMVLAWGTVLYTIVWGVIWITSYNKGIVENFGIQCVINFLLGFFAGSSVVVFAQLTELFPTAMAGTCSAALNMFPFAGGAILVTISGIIVSEKTISQYQTLWLIAFILMIVATICGFVSVEKKRE